MRLTYLLLVLFTSSLSYANIPQGRYVVDKIQCKTGKVVNFGVARFFMKKTFYLEVKDGKMIQTLTAKGTAAFPGTLDCVIVNESSFAYTQENRFEGSFVNTTTRCNDPRWTDIIAKRGYGKEKYGVFNYSVSGERFTLFRTDTQNKYSCDKAGDYPIYHYKKI